MDYRFQPKGVCSREFQIELDERNGQIVIMDLKAVGGCNGNLQGISALLRGMLVEDAIQRLKGIRCGQKATSCPDQIAAGLEHFLATSKASAEKSN